MLLASLGTSIANVGLPVLQEAFSATFQQVQWVVVGYLLAVTVTVVSVGRLGDVVGRKRLLMIGIILFMAAAALAGGAPTLWLLIGARAIQGVAAAIMLALSMALVGDASQGGKAGSAMGLLGGASALGTALGPALGGLLIAAAGWRWIFLIAVPIGVLALALVHRLKENTSGTGKARAGFDKLGTVLLGATLAAFALSMTTGGGGFGALNIALLAAALAGLILFLQSQRSAIAPLVQLSTLRQADISAGLVMSILVSTVLMATLVVGPFYLSQALALTPATVGLALSLGPLVVAVGSLPSGWATDRFGSRTATIVGLAGILTGSVMLSMLPVRLGVLGYLSSIVVLTSGYGLFQTANNVAVVAAADSDERGVASGMLSLSRNLGLIAGATVMAAIFASAAATHASGAPSQAVAGATNFTFGIAAGLILLALVVGIAGGRFLPTRAQPV
jgi:MFS family permease